MTGARRCSHDRRWSDVSVRYSPFLDSTCMAIPLEPKFHAESAELQAGTSPAIAVFRLQSLISSLSVGCECRAYRRFPGPLLRVAPRCALIGVGGIRARARGLRRALRVGRAPRRRRSSRPIRRYWSRPPASRSNGARAKPWFGPERAAKVSIARAKLTPPDRGPLLARLGRAQRLAPRCDRDGAAGRRSAPARGRHPRRADLRPRLQPDLRDGGARRRAALGRHPLPRRDHGVLLAVEGASCSTTATTARAPCGRAMRWSRCWPG